MRPVIGRPAALLGLALVVVGCGTPAAPSRVAVDDQVEYAHGAAVTVYRPTDADAAPVAVLLHGCCGDRQDLGQLARRLAAAGIVAVNASWTPLADGGGWPRSYGEAGCAVAWSRHHATAYGGDPDRVVLVGWSDGALLAAVAGLGGAPPLPTCDVAAPGTPDAVVALGGYFGLGLPGHDDLTTAQSRFLGANGRRTPGLPAVHLAATDAAPTWLVTGDDDELRGQAASWRRALDAAGHPVVAKHGRGSHGDVISPRTPLGATAVAAVRDAAEEVADG